MTFKKGQSGNPGGKPKQVLELVLEARKHVGSAIATASSLLNAEDDKVKLAAATFIRDTGIGRPSQVDFDLAQISDEKLAEEVRRRAEIRARERLEAERLAGLGQAADGMAAQQ